MTTEREKADQYTEYIVCSDYLRAIVYMFVFMFIVGQLTTSGFWTAAKTTIRIGKRVRQYKATKQGITVVVRLYSRLVEAARCLRENVQQ